MMATMFVAVGANAQVRKYKMVGPTETVKLYPEGQNVDKGVAQGPGESNCIADAETIWGENTGFYINIGDDARIDIYLPKKCNGQMVVVCPGGGYGFVSSINEGVNVANWLVANGIAACVVKYRLPNGHWTVPLTDVQNAFRYCRANAESWGVKQIGVIGFSAGGHLAASASTLYVDEITRPDFSILVYPVITMDKNITHMGTRDNLIGTDEKWLDKNQTVNQYEASARKYLELQERYSLQNNVTSDTPQTFIALSSNDTVVPVENSLLYYGKLVECGVPAVMHTYPCGGHGWGFNTPELFGVEGKDVLGVFRMELYSELYTWLRSINK